MARGEWSTARTKKEETTRTRRTPGEPAIAKDDHQARWHKATGKTTMDLAMVDGRKDSTRPIVGLAGCMKLMCRRQELGGCRNISTPWDPGWCHNELKGSLGPSPGGGIAFRCEACLSKEMLRPHSECASR